MPHLHRPWLLVLVLAACDAPVYYPNEPDPPPADTALPTPGTGTPTGTATGAGTPTGTTSGTPTVDGLPCSIESVVQVEFELVNDSAELVDVFWLDFACQPIFIARVFEGETLPQISYATHSFWAQDVAGTKVAEITLDTQPMQTLVVTP